METLLHKAFKELQKQKKVSTMKDFAQKLGVNYTVMSEYINGKKAYKDTIFTNIDKTFDFDVFKELDITEYDNTNNSQINNINEKDITKVSSEGERIRLQKAIGNVNNGIYFVPIYAQAGYIKSHLDPIYMNQLQRIEMPNMPYRGENYRMFEVEGESMLPTFKEGYYIIAEKVDPDYWTQIANYHVYVIVTEDRLMIKRLVFRNGNEFVCISDNKEFYNQFVLNIADIRELWFVKRKMVWEMPPPEKIEITV